MFFHGSGGFYEGNMSMETDGNGDLTSQKGDFFLKHRQGELINKICPSSSPSGVLLVKNGGGHQFYWRYPAW